MFTNLENPFTLELSKRTEVDTLAGSSNTWLSLMTTVMSSREYRRLVFRDEEFEVWAGLDSAGEVASFQLCYGRPFARHAVTWRRGRGYCHHRPGVNGWVEPCDMFPREPILEFLEERSHAMDSSLASFIRGKLREYREAHLSGRTITSGPCPGLVRSSRALNFRRSFV